MKCLFWALLLVADAAVTMPQSEEGLTYKLYENAALAGSPSVTGTTTSASLSLIGDDEKACYLSGELVGMVHLTRTGRWRFDCHFNHTSTGWVWMDGHLVCGDGHAYRPQQASDNPLPIRETERLYPFRAHITSNDTSCEHRATLRVDMYREGSAVHAGTTVSFVEESKLRSLQTKFDKAKREETKNGAVIFTPTLSAPEEKREELQRSLKTGWGSWIRANLLSIVKLPEGIAITPILCRRSTKECLSTAVPDDNTARVDLHAYDRSYVGFNVTFQNVTASIEYAVSNGDRLQALVSIVDCQDCSDFDIYFTARYAWFRPGSFTLLPAPEFGFSCNTPGLGTINVTFLADRHGERMDGIGHAYPPVGIEGEATIRFPVGMIGTTKLGILAGIQGPNNDEIETTLKANKARELERLNLKFGPNKAAVAEAIQCAIMWTLIHNPAENGPFMPVSRADWWSFTSKSGAVTSDWTYVIFEWDNLFASLLTGLDNKEIAYSNLFQVVKSKTAEGFIPNFSGAGAKSEDRTEPPVGAKVVLELFRKYKETWLVEVVFDDLLDWNNWFLATRVLQPVGLIALGSYTDRASLDGEVYNSLQSSRYESGLDNSPMYDGDKNLFDENITHMMQLYDVGMSSLFAQEAYSLADLADAIGRDPKVGQMLRKRASDMVEKISTHLWDSEQGIFANRFHNGTFSRHISPTSFYPLAVGAGSQEQVDGMLNSWLLNSTRFCISSEGKFQGNDPDVCYWGLPSISADDPTYMRGRFIYWRGYSWGPMAQLVYWSLKSSGTNDTTDKARRALCTQMEALVMSQWLANRHICENYHPHRNARDCSGTSFYHWGALNGFIGMVEDGFW